MDRKLRIAGPVHTRFAKLSSNVADIFYTEEVLLSVTFLECIGFIIYEMIVP